MEDRIVKLLLSLGIAPSLKGFRASVYAIELGLKEPNVLDRITKQLYPEVAKRLDTTASRVERTIRHAVERMFEYQTYEKIVSTLGLETNSAKGKYTNSEFISLCVMKLRNEVTA